MNTHVKTCGTLAAIGGVTALIQLYPVHAAITIGAVLSAVFLYLLYSFIYCCFE